MAVPFKNPLSTCGGVGSENKQENCIQKLHPLVLWSGCWGSYLTRGMAVSSCFAFADPCLGAFVAPTSSTVMAGPAGALGMGVAGDAPVIVIVSNFFSTDWHEITCENLFY